MSKFILYINPKGKKSAEPTRDESSDEVAQLILRARRQMAKYDPFATETEKALWGVGSSNGHFEPLMTTLGTHKCSCGEGSDSWDVLLPGGYITNTLAEHYLLWHRGEIPTAEMKKLKKMLEAKKSEAKQSESN